MKAGVFDSGVGGLTVLKSLLEAKLFEEIVYYGDTARVPYGIKDKNTIIRYSLEVLEFFKNFNIDLLITACNTVSSYALEELKKRAPFAVEGVIEPGIMAAKKSLNLNSSILVLGTKATINSGVYRDGLLREGFSDINSIATSLFIPIVEEGIFEGAVLDSAMRYYFEGMKAPDAIILGCTHFPLISKEIKRYFNNKPVIVHSGDAIVSFLKSNIIKNPQKFGTTRVHYFASENPEGLKRIASLWLGR